MQNRHLDNENPGDIKLDAAHYIGDITTHAKSGVFVITGGGYMCVKTLKLVSL